MKNICGIDGGLVSKDFLMRINEVSSKIISFLPQKQIAQIKQEIISPQIIKYNPDSRSIKLNLGNQYEFFVLHLPQDTNPHSISFKYKSCDKEIFCRIYFTNKLGPNIIKRFRGAYSLQEIKELCAELKNSEHEEQKNNELYRRRG